MKLARISLRCTLTTLKSSIRACSRFSTSSNPDYKYNIEDVTPEASIPGPAQIDTLSSFIKSKRRLVVITGAGVSTESGVPDYRSPNGSYSKGHKPVTYQEFVNKPETRKRYWARNMYGFLYFSNRQPNPTHTSLATLEKQGMVHHLITQNVDGLHLKAGHQRVIELHGISRSIACLQCKQKLKREEFQAILQALNPDWVNTFRAVPTTRPDGDADLGVVDYSSFKVPDCANCGGMLKPEVVFFGESVPSDVVTKAMGIVTESDGVLAIGTSLQVYSIFRFIKAADSKDIPIGIINIGPTRGDELKNLAFKIEARSGVILPLALANIYTNKNKERVEY